MYLSNSHNRYDVVSFHTRCMRLDGVEKRENELLSLSLPPVLKEGHRSPMLTYVNHRYDTYVGYGKQEQYIVSVLYVQNLQARSFNFLVTFVFWFRKTLALLPPLSGVELGFARSMKIRHHSNRTVRRTKCA